MDESTLERKLKAELDFYKVYAVFIIGLVTGDINLLLKYMNEPSQNMLLLLSLGISVLLVVFFFFMKSFSLLKNSLKINNYVSNHSYHHLGLGSINSNGIHDLY